MFSNVAWFVALWLTRLISVLWLLFNFCHVIVILFINLLFINMHLSLAKNSFYYFVISIFFYIYYIFSHSKFAAKKQTQTKQTLKNQTNKETKQQRTNYWLINNQRRKCFAWFKRDFNASKKRKSTRMNGKSPDKKHNCRIILFLLWSDSQMVYFKSIMRQWVK